MPYTQKKFVFTDVTTHYIRCAKNEPPTNSQEEDLLRLFIVSKEMDLTFDKTTYLVPLIGPETIKSTLSFIRKGVHNDSKVKSPEQPCDTQLALVYAIEGKLSLSLTCV